MQINQHIADGASVLGCVIALWTLVRVGSLRRAIGDHSVRRSLEMKFQEIINIPKGKTRITNSQKLDVNQILRYLDMFYLSWIPWKHRSEKKLIKKVRKELDKGRNVQIIKDDLQLLRDQFTAQG